MPKRPLQRVCHSWLWLNLILLVSSLTIKPLLAQVNDSPPPEQFTSPQDVQPASPPPFTSPQDVQPPSPPPLPAPELPQQLPSPENLLRPPGQPTPTPGETVPGEEATANITVKRFEFVGSTVFSQEQLASILARFTQKQISLGELFQARSAVT